MKTGYILKSLIELADIRQLRFADMINTSSSTVSKIINAKMLISKKAAHGFAARSARILAARLFEPNCHIKLSSVFPVIHRFSSKHDLELFLFNALLYSIELDQEESEKTPQRLQHKFYSEAQTVLHMFCIITSDYLQHKNDTESEVFNTVPVCASNVFDHLEITRPSFDRKLRFHQFCDLSQDNINTSQLHSGFLERVIGLETYTDLYYWQSELEAANPFLLLKDEFVLLFNTPIGGSTYMTLIRDPDEVENVYHSVQTIMKSAEKLSFNEDNLNDYLMKEEETESTIKSMLRYYKELKYNDESFKANSQTRVPCLVAEYLRKEVEIYCSVDAIDSFICSDKKSLLAPEGQACTLAERFAIIKQFKEYSEKGGPLKLHIIDTPLNNFNIICPDDLSLLGIFNPQTEKLKYHLINSNILQTELERYAASIPINLGSYILRVAEQEE